MGINRKQWLFNQIVAADPTKNTDDTLNGDLEEIYHGMVNSGKILRGVNTLSRFIAAGSSAVPATAPAVDTPTVSTSTTAATVSGRLVSPLDTSAVTVLGGRGDWDSTYGRASFGFASGLDFILDGDTVEFDLWPGNTGNSTYWIWVNGAPVTSDVVTIATTSSQRTWVKLVFTSKARRRIEFFCSFAGSIYGVNIPATQGITASGRRPVVGFIGDSFWGGSNGSSPFQCGNFILSRLLGVECVDQSLGGTGYTNAGAFGRKFGDTSRVSYLSKANPDLIVLQGSVNDDGASYSNIYTAALNTYSVLANALPGVPLIVFGPQPSDSGTTLSTNRQTATSAVQAACASSPNVLAFHDMVGIASGIPSAYSSYTVYQDGSLVTYLGAVWQLNNGGSSYNTGPTSAPTADNHWQLVTAGGYYGTGNTGSLKSDGTRDILLYSDGTHPTSSGSAALAAWEAALIRKDLRSRL